MTHMTAGMVMITNEANKILLHGNWNIVALEQQKLNFTTLATTPMTLTIDGSDIAIMDSVGAWYICKLLEFLKSIDKKVQLTGFKKEYESLIEAIKQNIHANGAYIKKRLNPLAYIGEATTKHLSNLILWLAFIGEIVITGLSQLLQPKRIRFKYFLNILDVNGYRALPIVGFLSFLIGVVLTYETGLQLRQYGANIYIIGLLGLATFREFAPLIAAIIIAGRTGSAFTAQLGLMKSNEEIDALKTMGHSPMEMLVLPRVFGLIVAMPLLTVWADITGVLGGMVMSRSMLDISYHDFIKQFPIDVTFTSFVIGMIKAPVFAAIIALVGCFNGFRVTGSAESIGLETTKSVVLAVFMIIVADAAFAIVLSWLNI